MDSYGFAILMFVFSGVLLLYAVGLVLGDTDLIQRPWAAKMGDRKAYARRLGKIVALVALAPLASGLVSLLAGETVFPGLVLVGSLILSIPLGVRLTRGEGEPEEAKEQVTKPKGGVS